MAPSYKRIRILEPSTPNRNRSISTPQGLFVDTRQNEGGLKRSNSLQEGLNNSNGLKSPVEPPSPGIYSFDYIIIVILNIVFTIEIKPSLLKNCIITCIHIYVLIKHIFIMRIILIVINILIQNSCSITQRERKS